ncbi:hypothetical protein CRENBAI_014416 [Crenichthys baileyi]|uniref:Uncharacterized protein n=1 Tax=Crenichthys baileyi TaxID=28760 RepID=A0AAV9RAF5_9TELE
MALLCSFIGHNEKKQHTQLETGSSWPPFGPHGPTPIQRQPRPNTLPRSPQSGCPPKRTHHQQPRDPLYQPTPVCTMPALVDAISNPHCPRGHDPNLLPPLTTTDPILPHPCPNAPSSRSSSRSGLLPMLARDIGEAHHAQAAPHWELEQAPSHLGTQPSTRPRYPEVAAVQTSGHSGPTLPQRGWTAEAGGVGPSDHCAGLVYVIPKTN